VCWLLKRPAFPTSSSNFVIPCRQVTTWRLQARSVVTSGSQEIYKNYLWMEGTNEDDRFVAPLGVPTRLSAADQLPGPDLPPISPTGTFSADTSSGLKQYIIPGSFRPFYRTASKFSSLKGIRSSSPTKDQVSNSHIFALQHHQQQGRRCRQKGPTNWSQSTQPLNGRSD
jgi:hypothetical protein